LNEQSVSKGKDPCLDTGQLCKKTLFLIAIKKESRYNVSSSKPFGARVAKSVDARDFLPSADLPKAEKLTTFTWKTWNIDRAHMRFVAQMGAGFTKVQLEI